MAETHQDRAEAILIVYDGACAFCQRSIAAIQYRDRDGQFIYLPRQTVGLDEQYPQIALADFETGMRLIEPDGTMHIGADAIYQIASRLPSLRWAAWMYHVPIVHGLTRRIYSWIATNRMKLSRHCGEACAISTDVGHENSIHNKRCYPRMPQLLISILIVLVIGLHAVPVLQELYGKRQTLWPIMAWGMYRYSYNSDRQIRAMKRHTIAITLRGKEMDIEAISTSDKRGFFKLFFREDSNFLGLGYFAFVRLYLGPMWAGDSSAAQQLADLLNRNREDPIVEFRLESETYAVTDIGVVKEENTFFIYQVTS